MKENLDEVFPYFSELDRHMRKKRRESQMHCPQCGSTNVEDGYCYDCDYEFGDGFEDD